MRRAEERMRRPISAAAAHTALWVTFGLLLAGGSIGLFTNGGAL